MRTVWVSFDTKGRACLEAAADCGADIVGIVTLPEPRRSRVVSPASFADLAARFNARLIETDHINDPAVIAAVRQLRPALIFVVGWSQLLCDEIVGLASEGVFGIHPTLLPKHRGRAPVPWTILSGLAATGVTLFQIADAGADCGPIVAQTQVRIERRETATTLYDKLQEAHVSLTRQWVPAILARNAPRRPQDDARATWWWKRSPADALIDWDTRAERLEEWVRAHTRPFSGALTHLESTRVAIWSATVASTRDRGRAAGAVVAAGDEGVIVQCGEGTLVLHEVELRADGASRPGRLYSRARVVEALPLGSRLG